MSRNPLRRLSSRFWAFSTVLLAGWAVLGPASPARADEPATEPWDDMVKGTWTFSAYAGYDRECSGDPQFGYGAVGAGYFFRNDASINGEFRTYAVDQEGDNASAIFELDLLIRHHVIKHEKWTLFFDIGAGIAQATDDVPANGTSFNFIEETGVGMTYRLEDHLHLIGGIRYYHLSNARLHGGDENPGLNGLGGYVGLLWTF